MSAARSPCSESEAGALSFSPVNQQECSSLFSSFPAEIRFLIFNMVFAAYQDNERPYPFRSYYRRPGYTAPKRTDIALLLTCKRIYLEWRDLIWSPGLGNDEEAFWWGNHSRRPAEKCLFVADNSVPMYATGSRGPFPSVMRVGAPQVIDDNFDVESISAVSDDMDVETDDAIFDDTNHLDAASSPLHPPFALPPANEVVETQPLPALDLQTYVDLFIGAHMIPSKTDHPFQCKRTASFSPEQWLRIKKIHIFPQMYTFDAAQFARFFHQAPYLRPKVVHVTIRYTDWWLWSLNHPLQLTISPTPESPSEYYLPDCCDTFILELESTEAKRKGLEWEVQKIIDNKGAARWRRLDDQFLELDMDIGVKEWEWMGPSSFNEGMHPDQSEGSTMKYIVKVLTFKAKPCPPTGREKKHRSFGEAVAVREYCANAIPLLQATNLP